MLAEIAIIRMKLRVPQYGLIYSPKIAAENSLIFKSVEWEDERVILIQKLQIMFLFILQSHIKTFQEIQREINSLRVRFV